MPNTDELASYTGKRTSLVTADLDPIVLGTPDGETREVLRPKMVINPHHPENGLSVQIVHQRKSQKTEYSDIAGDTWEDDARDLRKVKAGEDARISLDTTQT